MDIYKKLKKILSEKVYSEVQLWWVNNLNLTEKQAYDFVNLIEKISADSKTIREKASVMV